MLLCVANCRTNHEETAAHRQLFEGLLCVCLFVAGSLFDQLTRSHPEMVGDMSRVTLNFDLSKIPFVLF